MCVCVLSAGQTHDKELFYHQCVSVCAVFFGWVWLVSCLVGELFGCVWLRSCLVGWVESCLAGWLLLLLLLLLLAVAAAAAAAAEETPTGWCACSVCVCNVCVCALCVCAMCVCAMCVPCGAPLVWHAGVSTSTRAARTTGRAPNGLS